MRNLIIFGDSQFAERIYKYISLEGVDKVIAFTQEASYIRHGKKLKIPVLPFESLSQKVSVEFEIIIGIGYSEMNNLRKKIYLLCKQYGFTIGSYISANAFVYSDSYSEGLFVCPGAVIGPNCTIGVCNFFGSNSALSHDNKIGDYNFISTGSIIGGFAKINNNCFLGLNSTVRDNIEIADFSLVGASANVIKSTETQSVYIGNPARKMKELNINRIRI
ncbi:acetyltransferase [Bacteroidales bacterium OttesenSCG-928-L03]|nr:acetyltransferase [Bacteroidales bacterium OttesenSCG-928-L03]